MIFLFCSLEIFIKKKSEELVSMCEQKNNLFRNSAEDGSVRWYAKCLYTGTLYIPVSVLNIPLVRSSSRSTYVYCIT